MLAHTLVVNRPAETTYTSRIVAMRDYKQASRQCVVLAWCDEDPASADLEIWVIGAWEPVLTNFNYYRIATIDEIGWQDPSTVNDPTGETLKWSFYQKLETFPWMALVVSAVATTTTQRVWASLIE